MMPPRATVGVVTMLLIDVSTEVVVETIIVVVGPVLVGAAAAVVDVAVAPVTTIRTVGLLPSSLRAHAVATTTTVAIEHATPRNPIPRMVPCAAPLCNWCNARQHQRPKIERCELAHLLVDHSDVYSLTDNV